MSTHVVSIGAENADVILPRLLIRALPLAGVPSSIDYNAATGDLTVSWPYQLTAPQIAQLADIARAAKSDLSPNERNAIQSDIDGLVTYQGLATPTLAQTVLAVKAQSRILRALLRN